MKIRLLLPMFFGITITLALVFGAKWQSSTNTAKAAIPNQPINQETGQPTIRYVATTGSDTTTCTDSANPCATVQYAVDQTGEGSEVRVAGGEYTGVHTRIEHDPFPPDESLAQTVFISQPLTVRGGYTLTNWTVSDPVANPTTINPQWQGRGIVVMTAQGVTVEGFRVISGDATVDNYMGGTGGGIGVFYSSAAINHCYVEGNMGQGGVAVDNSAAILHGNVITGHIAGGVYGGYSIITMTQNIVSGNYGDEGGGIYTQESDVYLSGNTVTNNFANGLGGGIWIYHGNRSILVGNTIANNTANDSGGGLILVNTGTIMITGNLFIGNSSLSLGGAAFVGGPEVVFDNNLVVNNYAGFRGGGIFVNGSALSLSGNEIRGNVSNWDGGGVTIQGTQITLTGNSILSNTAMALGGGVLVDTSTFTGSANLANNIIANNHIAQPAPLYSGSGLYVMNGRATLLHNTIANNQGGDGTGIWTTAGTVTLTNNIIISHTVGISVYFGTAHLEATLWGNDTDWGGNGTITTGTINLYGNPSFIDPANGDYHLGPDSMAIDSGVDAGVITDIDGDPRPFGEGFDIGADEITGEASLQLTHTANASEIIAGDAITLSFWVTNTGSIPLNANIIGGISISPTSILVYGWETVILPGQVWTQTLVVASSPTYSGTLTSTVNVTTTEGASSSATVLITAVLPPEPPPLFKIYFPILRRE